jgi:branched-chain amino acid transport system substrate-binding protein
VISRRAAGSVFVALVILTGACSQGDQQGAKAPVVDASGGSTSTTVAPGDTATTAAPAAAGSTESGAAGLTPSSTAKPGSAAPTVSGGRTAASGPAAAQNSSGKGGSSTPAPGQAASAGPANATPTNAPPPGPGQPYKVGGIFPLSGGISALGRPAEQAARAYIQSINDAGGVNGHRIDFITEDDGGDPNRTRAAAEKLVERDGIFVMGPSFTPFSPDLVSFLEKKGVPFIGFDGVNVEGFSSPSTVTVGASIAPHARTLVPYWVEKTHVKRMAIVYLDVPPAVTYLKETRDVICPKIGCQVVDAQPVQFNTTDYTSILLRFRSQSVEGVFIVTDPGSAVKLLLQAKQQDYKPSPGGYLGQHGIYLDLVAGSCGSFCDGILAPTSLFPPQVKSPATDEMRKTVGKYFSNVEYGYFTELGYVSARLLVDVLRKAGSPDRAKVLEVARGLTAYDTGGFTNPAKPLDLTPGREHDRDMILMRMEKGVWKQETDWLTPRKF